MCGTWATDSGRPFFRARGNGTEGQKREGEREFDEIEIAGPAGVWLSVITFQIVTREMHRDFSDIDLLRNHLVAMNP